MSKTRYSIEGWHSIASPSLVDQEHNRALERGNENTWNIVETIDV